MQRRLCNDEQGLSLGARLHQPLICNTTSHSQIIPGLGLHLIRGFLPGGERVESLNGVLDQLESS